MSQSHTTSASPPTADEVPRLSEQQLLNLPHLGPTDYVDGKLIVSPATLSHGDVSARLLIALGNYVRTNRLGLVFDSSTGFWMKARNLRSPDVAFVPAADLKGLKRLPDGYAKKAPALAAEVLSPNDKPYEIESKLDDYFDSGVKLVWIIDPRTQDARVYRRRDAHDQLDKNATLDGEDVVPGFKLPLKELFEFPDFG